MDPDELVRQIEEARRRVSPLVPDIDPVELIHILEGLLRPFGSGRRFFVRPLGDHGHVL